MPSITDHALAPKAPSASPPSEFYWADYNNAWGTAHLVGFPAIEVDAVGERAACGQYLYRHAVDRNTWGHPACKRCMRTRANRAILEGRA